MINAPANSSWFWVVLVGIAVLYVLFRARIRRDGSGGDVFSIMRSSKNPILGPRADHAWESEAVFNPGAIIDDGIVHLFYRAMGADGVSRIGYARSHDGVHFEREQEPVFVPSTQRMAYQNPFAHRYDRDRYASGGGWSGAEDPRAVRIGDRVYLTFSLFEGWNSIRMGFTSIPLANLRARSWTWSPSHSV